MKRWTGTQVIVEGHCDARGSAEYNLGMGDRFATSVKDLLVLEGIPRDDMKTISYGKERTGPDAAAKKSVYLLPKDSKVRISFME